MGDCPSSAIYCRVPGYAFVVAQASSSEGSVAKAKEHFKQGNLLFAKGNYVEARQEYQTAYDLSGKPKLLYNIGLCHKKLGEFEPAIRFFKQYLADLPHAENKDDVDADIFFLQERLKAGEGVPLTPLVNIVAKRPTPAAASDPPLPDLEPIPGTDPAPTAPPPAVSYPPPPPVVLETSVKAEPRGHPYRTALWASSAVAALSLVGAGAGYYMAHDRADQYADRIRELKAEGEGATEADRSRLNGLKSKGQLYEKISIGSGVSAGVFCALTGVLWFMGREKPATVSAGGGPGSFYVSVERRF